MIKLETHCHVRGSSACADADIQILLDKYITAGYKAILVTNHFSVGCYDKFFVGNTHKEKVDYFFKVYDDFSKLCKEKGIKTFWGAEIRVKDERCSLGTEYMVVGLPRSAYYSEPPLFELGQKELFELAEKHGAFMYQTHPFRVGVYAGDPKYLHGAEYFNGHFHHDNHNECAEKFVTENNLIGLSGTDFHHGNQPITAGIYLPEEISDEKSYVKFLFENNFKIVQDKETYLYELKKCKGLI